MRAQESAAALREDQGEERAAQVTSAHAEAQNIYLRRNRTRNWRWRWSRLERRWLAGPYSATS